MEELESWGLFNYKDRKLQSAQREDGKGSLRNPSSAAVGSVRGRRLGTKKAGEGDSLRKARGRHIKGRFATEFPQAHEKRGGVKEGSQSEGRCPIRGRSPLNGKAHLSNREPYGTLQNCSARLQPGANDAASGRRGARACRDRIKTELVAAQGEPGAEEGGQEGTRLLWLRRGVCKIRAANT